MAVFSVVVVVAIGYVAIAVERTIFLGVDRLRLLARGIEPIFTDFDHFFLLFVCVIVLLLVYFGSFRTMLWITNLGRMVSTDVSKSL